MQTKKILWRAFWFCLVFLSFILFAHRAWFIPETDFVAYYNAGLRSLSGETPYYFEPTPYKYLPVTSFLFIPFTLFKFQTAKFIFFILSFCAGLWVYWKIHQKYGNTTTLIVLISMIRFHNHDFLNSQINHILLFLFMFYLMNRNTLPWVAAFAFGFFSSFKIIPAVVLLPVLLMRKQKEALKIFAAFFVLNLLPILFFKSGIRLYQDWYHLLSTTTPLEFGGSSFQSIHAALGFWFSSFATHPVIQTASLVICIFLFIFCCFKSFLVKNDFQENNILAATITLSVIASPLAWKHNYLLLLPSILFLLKFNHTKTVWMQFFLMTLLPAFLSLFSKQWADQSYVTLIGALLIFFSLFKSSPYFKTNKDPSSLVA